MGMYSLIEDANNKRLAELVASGMTEREAAEALHDEQEAEADRHGREPA